MIEGVCFRHGVIAMPYNAERELFYLLPDSGQNSGKIEAVFGRSPLYASLPHKVIGAEFTGGGIKDVDKKHGETHNVRMLTRFAAVRREIREETSTPDEVGLLVENDQLWEMGSGFYVLQLRKNKLQLFHVGVILWSLNDAQETWLTERKRAIELTRDQVVNYNYGVQVRPRDLFTLRHYAREQHLSQL